MQDERCPQCGLPKYICQNEDNDVQFRVEEERCSAQAAEDNYRNPSRGRKGGKEKEIPAGVALRPVPYTDSGRPLSELREPYYEALLKARKEAN